MIPVILIGGIPGVGKTSLSGYIGNEFNINIILSGDYLREFLRPYADNPTMKESVYNAYKIYGEKNEENIIKGYLDQVKYMYMGINAILRRAINNGEPVILETLYFIPELIEQDLRAHIIMIYIHISDITVHEKRLKERVKYTHFNSPGERLVDQLPVYRIIEKYSMENCNSDVYMVDNANFTLTKSMLKSYIKSKIND
jgi:mevalonate-3-phosphate-5-kinase